MTTVAQLVIATILNFLGMTPEAKIPPAPVKAEIDIESEFNAPLLAEKGNIYHTYIFKEADDFH